jgi:hypothetical protein
MQDMKIKVNIWSVMSPIVHATSSSIYTNS